MSDPKQRGPTIKEGCRYILDERGREKASFDVKQAPYNFGTTQVEVCLKVGVEYYIVPSLYKRNQAGTFFLNVYADVDSFHLDGGTTVVDASAQPMVIGNPSGSNQVTLKMSQAQYFDKKESLRERICAEAKRLGMSPDQLAAIFNDLPQDGDGAKMSRADFKRRMVDMGFMLTDFPDDDLVVLDADNDGTITPAEFVQFVREGQKFADTSNVAGPPPAAPVDDLLLKPPSLAGELTVTFTNGRNLRPATTWFNSKTVSEGKAAALSKPAAEESGAAAAAAAAAVAATEEAVNPLSRK